MTITDEEQPSANEIDALYQWCGVKDFVEYVTKLDISAKTLLLTSGRLKPLREALILSDFAKTLGFAECRLCREEFPDAELKYAGGRELQIEITEVLTPGRKRNDEYRNFAQSPENAVSHHDWEGVKEAGSHWIDWVLDGLNRKLKYDKHSKFDIVIYNNISHLFDLPEIAKLSDAVGSRLKEVGYFEHWVWQCRSTTIDLLWPRLLRLRIPGWEDRF